jgi:peptidoglycan/xylan/chitin deacetylase (PgdA/CDA1 family)
VALSANPTRVFLKKIFLETCRFIGKESKNYHRIPVLCYHRVLPEILTLPGSVLPEQFDSQLNVLREEGFKTLSLTEYERMARGLDPIRERSVLLTFDDGFADNYAIAWKIAQKHNIKINLFICTSTIGQASPAVMGMDGCLEANSVHQRKLEESVRPYLRKFPHLWRPLTWQELREMQDSGVQIGFHSHNHRNMALLTPQELVTDTISGLGVMERELGQRPRFFAFPYGFYQHYTPQVISSLTSLGIDLIFAAHPGLTKLPSRQLLFPRIAILQQDDLATFRQKIWGAYDWREEILQKSQAIKGFLRK